MKSNFELKYKFTRKIWKKLHDSNVPIVLAEHLEKASLEVALDKINRDLRNSQYLPSINHGFLGINKSHGVTRFIPILTREDMAVYYYICYLISGKILEKRESIYGGWHIIPDVQQKDDILTVEQIEGYLQDYFSDSVSKKNWWKEWTRFIDMIADLTSRKDIGNYILTSDIANFYDSISVDTLIKKLRKKTSKFGEQIDVLEVFLGFWNRLTNGYSRSTKGIPQELFSDASRVLSHFYLQDFDKRFLEYCNNNSIIYCRWADDFLLFGKSPKKLEAALHKASKFLLSDGLHLSAGKTKIMSRIEYRAYRCIPFLEAVQSNDIRKYEKSLRAHKKLFDAGEIRVDTLLKTAIGHSARNINKIGSYPKLFIDDAIRSNVDLSLTLNDQQIYNVILLNPKPGEIFQIFVRRLESKPYASSRATFLKMLRKHKRNLVALGISEKAQMASIGRIERASSDSVILREICIPEAKRAY